VARLGRLCPRPSQSTLLTARITATAGALSALVVLVWPSGWLRHPHRGADDLAAAAARARAVSSPAAPPAGPVSGKSPPEGRAQYAIERAVVADRRADARAAAERRADRLAAPASPAPSALAPSAPAPTAAGNFSFAALEALWERAGGPAWAASQAASIAECESGGNPRAYNPSGASGLWQILGQPVPGNIFDPLVNAENAVAKFRASGDTFAQWVC
jgi:hypothetical protein